MPYTQPLSNEPKGIKMIWTKTFWQGAGERAIKTGAQTVTALVAAGTLGITEVDWVSVADISALAVVLSIFTSIGNADFTAGVQNDPAVMAAIKQAKA